jgi:hypothetical protein
MSYKLSPQVTRAGAPGVTDDSTSGFFVGSAWVDTTPNPDVLYVCTSSTAGAATWVQVSTVTAHTALTALGWSASGHTGTVTSVAAFDGTGAAQSVAATQDGTVLSRVGGVLAWVALAATVSLIATETTEYLLSGAVVMPEATAVVQDGVIA